MINALRLILALLILAVSVISTSIISPEPTTASGERVFGIDGFLSSRWQTNEIATGAQTLKELGAAWDREEFNWAIIQPEDKKSSSAGEWNWGAYDQAVAALRARDIQIVGLLDYSAPWASATGTDKGKPDIAAWKSFVSGVVSRYKGKVAVWEIWNEPNRPEFWSGGPLPLDYADILIAASDAAKAADSSAKVISGGIAGADIDFLESVFSKVSWDKVDGIGAHLYRGTDSPENMKFGLDNTRNELGKVVAFVNRHGGKGIYITEFGYSTHTVPDFRQAQYLIRQSLLMRSHNEVKAILWYDLREDTSNDPNEAQFGLIRRDGSSKPAATAFAQLASRIDGRGFLTFREINVEEFISTYDGGISGWGLDGNTTSTGSLAQATGRSGSGGMQVNYQFNAGASSYLRIVAPQTKINKKQTAGPAISGKPSSIGLWVSGDNSRSLLFGRITDASGETHQGLMTTAMIGDGNFRYAYMGFGNKDGFTHFGGNNNGVIEYPIRFDSLIIQNVANNTAQSGAIILDHVVATHGADDFNLYETPDRTLAAWVAGGIREGRLFTYDASPRFAFDRLGTNPPSTVIPTDLRINIKLFEDPLFFILQ